MALWGNKDSKSATGTIAIADTGVVTGTDTEFTTEADIGNYIRVDGVDYQIVTITSDTVAKVESGINGGAIAVVTAGASYTLSEKPASVAASESSGSPSGVHGNSNKVFGVDKWESFDSAGRVVEIGIASGGTQYAEAPTVTITGGGGSGAAATATISGGVVTAITMTNVGGSYETVPAVSLNTPTLTIPSTMFNTNDTITYSGSHYLTTGDSVNFTIGAGDRPHFDAVTVGFAAFNLSTEEVTSAAHPFITGDYVRYNDGAGTAPTGLTTGNYYFIIKTGANTFKLAASYADAIATSPVVIGLSGSPAGASHAFTNHLTNDKPMFVIRTGATTFKLARTSALATAGTSVDVTYVGTNGSDRKMFLTSAATAATAVANVGGGTDEGESPTGIAHAGWIRRTVGTGGRAGRVQYETLVAMGSITGDQADDMQFQDD